MLIDDLLEMDHDLRMPNGFRYGDAHKGIQKRASGAEVYVLDADAIAMACGVALSKPSSILSALPFVRLPYEWTWVEWAAADVRSALSDLGSPNKTPPQTLTVIERAGMLMREIVRDGTRVIQLEYVHRDRVNGSSYTDLAPVRGEFIIPDEQPDPEDYQSLAALRLRDHSGARDKVRRQIDMVSSDPKELAAAAALEAGLRCAPHPDLDKIREGMIMMMGKAKVEETEDAQGAELQRHFMIMALPALILLNTRNAVREEVVPAPQKLNKARAKKGRPPLVEHKLVKVSLTKGEKKYESTGTGAARSPYRSSLVSGHFKVRKTGIFFWRPHARHGYGAVKRTTVVTG